jgi:hypothetical protein
MCDALTTHWTRITEGRRERMASSSAPCGENWNPSLDPIVARVWAVTGDALKISRERERTAMLMPAKPAKPTDKPALSLVVDRKTTFSRPLETEVQASIERLIGDDIRRCYARTLQATQGHGVFALSLVVAENGTATGLRVDRELDRSLARCVVHRLKARVFPKQNPSVEVGEEWDFQWSGAE